MLFWLVDVKLASKLFPTLLIPSSNFYSTHKNVLELQCWINITIQLCKNDFSVKSTCSKSTFLTVHFPIQVDFSINNWIEGLYLYLWACQIQDTQKSSTEDCQSRTSHQKSKTLWQQLFCCTVHNVLWNEKLGVKSFHIVPGTLHSIATFLQNSPNDWPDCDIPVYSTKKIPAIYHVLQIM